MRISDLSSGTDINKLKQLLASGAISQDDLNNSNISGSFGPAPQNALSQLVNAVPPNQPSAAGVQDDQRGVGNVFGSLDHELYPQPDERPLSPQEKLMKDALAAQQGDPDAMSRVQNAMKQGVSADQYGELPSGNNFVKNETTGLVTYLGPNGPSNKPTYGSQIQGSQAPVGGSAYTGSTRMMPQRQDPNAPQVTRVLGSGAGTTVDLGAAQPDESSRPELASGRNPIDIPGAGRGYYGKDGNAYVPNGDGTWTKVLLGYDMQGSMALNKQNMDMAKSAADIAHTNEQIRASQVNNPDWMGTQGSFGGDQSGAQGADLSNLPPGVLNQAQAIANGDAPLPSTRSGKLSPIAALAFQINPALKATDYQAKQSTTKDFATGGKSGQVVQAINQALHHASTVSDAIDALNNSNVAPSIVNPVVNAFEQHIMGDTRQGNFSTAAMALSEELKKIYAGGGGGSLAELQSWQRSFDPNAGQAQQKSYLAQGMNLLQGAIQARQESYQRGMGPSADFGKLFTPQALEALQKLQSKGYIAGSPVSQVQGQAQGSAPQSTQASQDPSDPRVVVAPDGSRHRFPTTAQAAQFMRAIQQ